MIEGSTLQSMFDKNGDLIVHVAVTVRFSEEFFENFSLKIGLGVH